MEISFDKENIGNLTDDELRATLKQIGITPGPIMASTRKVYEKKLKNFLETGALNNTTLNSTNMNNTTVNNTTVNTTTNTSTKTTRSSQRAAANEQKDNSQVSSNMLAPIENLTSTSNRVNLNSNEIASLIETANNHRSARTASPRKTPVKKSASHEQVLSHAEIPPSSQVRPVVSNEQQNVIPVVRLNRVEEAVLSRHQPTQQQQQQPQTVKQIANPYKKIDDIPTIQQPLQPVAQNNKQFSSNLFSENSSNTAHLSSYIPVRSRQQNSTETSSSSSSSSASHELRNQQPTRQNLANNPSSVQNNSPAKTLTSSVYANNQYRTSATTSVPKPDISTVRNLYLN
jgi:hypothetical protein